MTVSKEFAQAFAQNCYNLVIEDRYVWYDPEKDQIYLTQTKALHFYNGTHSLDSIYLGLFQ